MKGLWDEVDCCLGDEVEIVNCEHFTSRAREAANEDIRDLVVDSEYEGEEVSMAGEGEEISIAGEGEEVSMAGEGEEVSIAQLKLVNKFGNLNSIMPQLAVIDYEERIRALNLYSTEQRSLRGDLILMYRIMTVELRIEKEQL